MLLKRPAWTLGCQVGRLPGEKGASTGPGMGVCRPIAARPLRWQSVADMTNDEVVMLREQKMTALRQAREAYRQSMVEPERSELGGLFAGRRSKLQTAVKAAEAELRLFDLGHPRA